jgi:hypothetical protein
MASNNKPSTNKGAILVIACIAAAAIYLVVKSNLEMHKIERNPVYLLARINKIESSSHGVYFYFSYVYGGKSYEDNINQVHKRLGVGDLIYVKVAADDPAKEEPLYELSVPPCLTLDSVPAGGWKQIPENVCK